MKCSVSLTTFSSTLDHKKVHEMMCVPKSSCLSFDIMSTSSDGSSPPVYALTMDGVTYRSGEMKISEASRDESNIMGQCNVNALCDQSSQALFEMELQTASEFIVDRTSYAAINSYDVNWVFDFVDPDDRGAEPLSVSSDYISSSYNLGSTYRTIECVPDIDCEYEFTCE